MKNHLTKNHLTHTSSKQGCNVCKEAQNILGSIINNQLANAMKTQQCYFLHVLNVKCHL